MTYRLRVEHFVIKYLAHFCIEPARNARVANAYNFCFT